MSAELASDRLMEGIPVLSDQEFHLFQALIHRQAGIYLSEQKRGLVSLGHLLYPLNRCYGKVLDEIAGDVGASNADLVDEVRLKGLPRRLHPSSLAAGLTWSQLLDQLRRVTK